MPKQVDRNLNIMKENWGTTKLITDYDSMNFLREVTTEKYMPKEKINENEIFEEIEDEWEYGIEPRPLNS